MINSVSKIVAVLLDAALVFYFSTRPGWSESSLVILWFVFAVGRTCYFKES